MGDMLHVRSFHTSFYFWKAELSADVTPCLQ